MEEKTTESYFRLLLVGTSGMFGNATEGELAMLLDLRTVEKEIDSDNLLHRSYSEDLDPNSEIVSFSCSGRSFFPLHF